MIDPVKLLQERASREERGDREVAAALVDSGLDFEIPLTPPAGARLMRVTIASTYRDPIQVQYDPSSRTTYPLPNKG